VEFGLPGKDVVIIGAGIGGLSAALQLAARGHRVTVLEKALRAGGKLREIMAGGKPVDAGPTVFTMKWVFDDLMADAGLSLDGLLVTKPVHCLARHAWSDDARLDLFADVAASADAIGDFAGSDAAQDYRRFCQRARQIYDTLLEPFMRASRPSPLGLMNRVGIRGLGDLLRISPFTTFARALEDHFRDPRLRQLFGRYATYCGSSPYQAPATLMLVAHVEQDGVWLIEGGMHRLAATIESAAKSFGARFVYGAQASQICVSNGQANAVETDSGERFPADAIIMNGDVAALAAGLLGPDVERSSQPVLRKHRSLSAVTWTMTANASGFPLTRHNVFFSSDYKSEFNDIFGQSRLPRSPTVYVCAQDRDDAGAFVGRDSHLREERLLCLVNAPANGDHSPAGERELKACEEATFRLLSRCGLTISAQPENSVRTTPAEFERLFPATGGALYGRASHGWMASFLRPGSRTKIAGLYTAGGSVHPGPGVPMAALSGRQAAASVMEDLASTSTFRQAATIGGTSMR
jgi:1-hydroxycarotenoid 3,4-desaturase